MSGNGVTWKVYAGRQSGRQGRVSIKLEAEKPTKREAYKVVRGLCGGKFVPILRKGHSYTVIVPRNT